MAQTQNQICACAHTRCQAGMAAQGSRCLVDRKDASCTAAPGHAARRRLVGAGRQLSDAKRDGAHGRVCVQNLSSLREASVHHLSASTSAAAEQRSATNRLFAGYLLLSAPAMLFPHRPPFWLVVLAIHVIAAAALIGVGPIGRFKQQLSQRFPRSFEFIADWYLLALVPLLYTELAVLNAAIWNGRYFDDLIIGWEQSVFGGQPSRELATRFPSVVLSEFLHSAYLSYYLIIYTPFIILYAQNRREAHRVSAFAV